MPLEIETIFNRTGKGYFSKTQHEDIARLVS